MNHCGITENTQDGRKTERQEMIHAQNVGSLNHSSGVTQKKAKSGGGGHEGCGFSNYQESNGLVIGMGGVWGEDKKNLEISLLVEGVNKE